MKRTSWILGSFAILALAACSPRGSNAGGAGAESGATGGMTSDTGMAPAATPTDTALAPTDTTGKSTQPGADTSKTR